jgi:hypothetical protein
MSTRRPIGPTVCDRVFARNIVLSKPIGLGTRVVFWLKQPEAPSPIGFERGSKQNRSGLGCLGSGPETLMQRRRVLNLYLGFIENL